MRMPFDSEEARALNKDIHETIYYGAMEASMELAEKDGPYKSYKGSPASKGIFQFDWIRGATKALQALSGRTHVAEVQEHADVAAVVRQAKMR